MYRFAARRTGGRISIMLPIWRLVRGAMIGLLVVVVACSLPSDQRAAFAAVADATTRVSVTSEGTQSSYTCLEPTISSDGSCVVFRSFSSDLVAGDSNGEGDIFVHDRNTGVTSRVSVDSDGTQANNDCYEASISSDGRYVSYRSSASNLVAGDTNGALDIFVHDRSTGVTSRVSVDSDGTQANSDSYSPAISSDGRYVTYCSFASNLIVGDTNGAWDVFVHDRNTGVTSRVSVASDGTEGNSGSSYPFVSSDGRYVTYCSDASNLVVGDTNALVDIFVHDRSTGVTSRADVALDGTQSNGACYDPSISTDGRYVTYYSLASNLVTDDTNGTSDVFVRDRNTGVTSRVSASSDSAQGNDYCFTPSISPDGRYITFCTESSGLVAGDTNSTYDVFVHDRNTAVTTRASVTSDGSQANSESGSPSMSADGRYIAFYSEASNLVAGDTNASGDVFV
ncbi:MAG: hypothetical protein L6413_00535, partial [Coriobacteriia bacterium]|nr:hypothetical protein [Coriobacteriia bacterium]